MKKRFISVFVLIIMLMQAFNSAFAAVPVTDTAPSYSVKEMETEFNTLMQDFKPYEKAKEAKKIDDASFLQLMYKKLSSYPNVKRIAWDDEDTIVFTLSKGMQAVYTYNEQTKDFCDDDVISKTESGSYSDGTRNADATDAVMFGPFYGIQSTFDYYENQYQNYAQKVAQMRGGSYYSFLGHNCTPAVVRNYGAKYENAVVIFSGHGEKVGGCSYINAWSRTGISSADIQAGNARASASHSGYYLINGNFITSNRTVQLNHDCLWWFAACEGMMTQGLCAPLRECGVGCVAGYSNSVTFGYEIYYGKAFWDKFTEQSGNTVAYCAQYAKDNVGYTDTYDPTLHTRPIFVSYEDQYPVSLNVNQTVNCTMTVYSYDAYIEKYHIKYASNEAGFTVSNMPVQAESPANMTNIVPANVPTRVRDANPYVSGGTFAGWRMGMESQIYQPGDTFVMPPHDITFIAVWTDVEYAVTYKDSGTDSMQAFLQGNTVTVENALTSHDDKVFGGWMSSFDNKVYQPGDTFIMPDDDIVMTALYTNLYSVVFRDYDDTVLSEQKVMHGEAAKAPENPVREGYRFTGWDRDFECVTEDMTVKALYEEIILIGDVNGNGSINTADATMILKASACLITLTEKQKIAADVNGNGMVNTADVTAILKYVVGTASF